MVPENIQNLIYIDGSFYKIKTDATPTEGSTALMTSGDIYTAFTQFNKLRGINVADRITFTGAGQNTMSNTEVPTIKAVYDFVIAYLKYKNILDANGNKV